ncbi:MAG: amidase [Saccharofermentanales bacterium]
MNPLNMLNNPKLDLSAEPPYDALQAFVRENHIALKGLDHGPLKGLTFAAKDVFKILGSTYGNGHPEWLRTNSPDDFTSSLIVRLLESGADLAGKTVCDELCFSISGENWHYGSPINPHDPRRYAGGSSSGTGAATAGGLVDFGIGSDCLGSVRVPASYNGLLGLRPTYERIPNDGEAPYCKSMDVLAYVAKEPETFKRVSGVMLGEDKFKTTFNKMIIAKDCFAAVNKDVQEALQPAVAYIAEHVSSVEETNISLEGLDNWVETFQHIQGYEVWESYGSWIRKHNPRLSRGPKERLEWASTITMQQYKDAYSRREFIIDRIHNLLSNDTLIIMPTAASIAPLRSAPSEEINAVRKQSSLLLCVSPLTNTPQLTLPMIKQNNVPLGISLLGPIDSDLSLAEFGAEIVGSFLAL